MTVGCVAQYWPCHSSAEEKSVGKSFAIPSNTLRMFHDGVVRRASRGVNVAGAWYDVSVASDQSRTRSGQARPVRADKFATPVSAVSCVSARKNALSSVAY